MIYLYRSILLCALLLLLAQTEQYAQTYWQAVGTPPGDPRTIAVHTTGDIYLGTFTGMYRFSNTGEQWQSVSFPETVVRSIVCSSHGILYVASGHRRVYRSADNGTTWNMVLDLGGEEYDSYNLLVDASHRIYAAAIKDKGVRYSDDEGATWTEINAGLSDLYINSITQDKNGNLLACTEAEGLFVFDMDESLWRNLGVYQTTGHNTINVAVALPDNVLFAASPFALYRSSDGGEHWTTLLGGTVTAMLAVPGGHLIIAGYDGPGSIVLSSPDGGQTWGNISGGAGHMTAIRQMIMADNTVYLIGAGGVFRANLATSPVADVHDQTTTSHVYPNPATESATVAFTMAAPGHATVRVYSTPGNLVATLFDGYLPAGGHTALWNTALAAPGIYHYKIIIGTSVSTGMIAVGAR